MSTRSIRRPGRAAVRSVAVLCLVLPTASALAQSSPTTITPDRATTLVSKDINGQRWAIARDHATGAVSGNVFTPGSPDPQFVWCTQTADTADGYSYNCFGAGRCDVADCAASWTGLAIVTLPHAFFAAGAAPQPTPTPAPTPVRTATPAPASCPRSGPLTNLQIDCSALVYFYRLGILPAAMSSNGRIVAVCITDGEDVLCARGPVVLPQAAELAEINLNSGPFIGLDGGSRLEIANAGHRMDVRYVLQGETFTFDGFVWFDTDTATSTSEPSSLFVPRSRSALEGALDDDAHLEAAMADALRRFAE